MKNKSLIIISLFFLFGTNISAQIIMQQNQPATILNNQNTILKEYISNGSFNEFDSTNGTKGRFERTLNGSSNSSGTAMKHWPTMLQPPNVYENNSRTTFVETEWINSTHPAGGKMLRVNTLGVNAGVNQVFLPFNTGPTELTACVWIYVVRGQVDIGLGNGGNAGAPGVRVFEHNKKWIKVQIPSSSSPVNEIAIFSCWNCPNGAEFYIQSVSVTESSLSDNCCQAN